MTPDVLPPPGWNLAIPNSLALPSSSNDFTMALETSSRPMKTSILLRSLRLKCASSRLLTSISSPRRRKCEATLPCAGLESGVHLLTEPGDIWHISCMSFRRRKNMARTLCVLALIGVTSMIGYSQETASEYVSPSEAVPRGKAPKMKVQLLTQGESTKQYAIIFYQGDEAFSGLLEFAEKYQVTSAHFTAIGALNGATLGWFDPQRKMYKKIPVDGQHEVIGMSGDIALFQGKPVVHTHMIVGGNDGTTRGGHVLAAYVSPTLEVMVTVDPVTMQKRLDPATDLTLIDPALK